MTNTGSRPGVSVPQLYVGLPSSKEVPQPPRKLAGFTRLEIPAGRTQHATINLDSRSLRYWDITTHGWRPVTGAVKAGDRCFVGGYETLGADHAVTWI